MKCSKCKKEIPQESAYCLFCGKKIKTEAAKKPKARGNGTGSVYRLPNGKWRAVVVLGYEADENGKKHRIERTKSNFKTKKEALEYLPTLKAKPKDINIEIKFKDLYELWLPTHQASASTINCYKAAYKYYRPIWHLKFAEIGIDDLQECIDECPHGKRTRQLMKVLGTLLYKYALPRGYVPTNLNYAQFLKVRNVEEVGTREAMTIEEVELIRRAVGVVPYADYIYCMIYTGFRPQEFLSLAVENYNRAEKCFVGGGKTEAGTNRSVTVSPKIAPIVERLTDGKKAGMIFCDEDGKAFALPRFRENCFYPAIAAAGITRKLTPYSTRHTFASLMMRVLADDKNKLALMGHTSTEMLRHYQHPNYDDLRKITDKI